MKEANFFCKAQPVVSGITVFNFDFMRFDLDFLGIYVIDIPITWMSILLSIKVEADIYGTNEKGKGGNQYEMAQSIRLWCKKSLVHSSDSLGKDRVN